MTKIIFAIALMLVGIAHAQNQPDSFTQMLGDKKLWETLDWNHFETSKVVMADGWNSYPITRTVRIQGFDFKAEVKIKFQEDNTGKTRLLLSATDRHVSKCEKIISWAVSQFGSPTAYTDVGGDPVLEQATQWDIGQSRMQVDCFSIIPQEKTSEEDMNLQAVHLIFTHKSEQKPITPMFMLSCTRKLTYWNGKTEDLPTTIYVDEFWKIIRNKHTVPFAAAVITPEIISYTHEDEKSLYEFSIDRTTGHLSGTANRKGNDKYLSRFSGVCEKVDPASKKF